MPELKSKRCGHPELNWRRVRQADLSYRERRRRLEEGSFLARYVACRNLSKPHTSMWLQSDARPVALSRSKEENAFARLEEAARAGHEGDFLKALKDVRWYARPALDFIRAIQLALQADAHMAARQISAEGARLHPNDVELQKQARILAAPRVIARTAAPNPAHRANRDWLKANSDEYHGQWVAVRNGELVSAANSLEELVERVGNTKGVLLTVA